jgi:hypothetical protein
MPQRGQQEYYLSRGLQLGLLPCLQMDELEELLPKWKDQDVVVDHC